MIVIDILRPPHQARTLPRAVAFLARPVSWLVALSLTFGLASATSAQTPMLRCAELLSAAQVKAIFGPSMADAMPRQHEAGESECVWRRGTGATAASLAVRFFDRQAIGSNSVARTLDSYYEMLVTAGEEVGDKKREAVAGVPRAALIQASPQILVVVQRADGVARVVLGNLTRAQAVAVAKVIAAP